MSLAPTLLVAIRLVSSGPSRKQDPGSSEWSFLIPDHIDEKKCFARICNNWRGAQCQSLKLPTSGLCKRHANYSFLKYGYINAKPPTYGQDGQHVYAKFLDTYRKAAGQSLLSKHGIVPPPSAQNARALISGNAFWYSRHHFFRIAHADFKVTQLQDLTAEQFSMCLKKCHRTLRAHPHLRVGLIKGAGPCRPR